MKLVKKVLKFCLNYHLLELYCSIERSSNRKLMYPRYKNSMSYSQIS